MKASEIQVGKTYENASGKKRRKVASFSPNRKNIWFRSGDSIPLYGCSVKAFSNWAVREVKE